MDMDFYFGTGGKVPEGNSMATKQELIRSQSNGSIISIPKTPALLVTINASKHAGVWPQSHMCKLTSAQ